MTHVERPKVFGTGLIALDLVMGMAPESSVRSWAGGTCGNVLSILAYLGWDAYPIARMNGDPASERVRADMARWGVRLEFASCTPTTHTPIIIQEIRRGRDGAPTHRFSWSCPSCGQWLPGFKPVTLGAVEAVADALPGAAVFFLDRLSRASLTLAARASAQGAIVVFEPSGKADGKLFAEAVRIAHVVKYADQRLLAVGEVMVGDAPTLLEVQTMGAKGLRYRHRFSHAGSNWLHLDAVPAPRLVDTCGSGDWCTTGFLAKVATAGQAGLRQAGAKGVRTALRYGQALAAWNCGFEGARGGMYSIDRQSFNRQIDALVAGRPEASQTGMLSLVQEVMVACPSCPPGGPRGNRTKANSRERRPIKSAVALRV